MRTAVLIPTVRGDTPTLRAALRSLADQTSRPFQVVVSIDHASAPAPDVSLLRAAGIDAEIVRGEQAGPAAARNRALRVAGGDIYLFLNDDVIPEPECVAAHEAFHAAGAPALALGNALWWFGPRPRRVIDRLVAETSLVFFYDQMEGAPADRDWGFRHAWTLNLSVPAGLCHEFNERLRYPMFDDLEWAERCTRGGAAVRYVPSARVEHRHHPLYTPGALLRRESLIGNQARVLQDVAPACFVSVFGSDGPGFASGLSEAARRTAQRAYQEFVGISDKPGSGVDIRRVYEVCWPWREAARSIGWGAGADPSSDEREALAVLAGITV